MMNQRIEKIKKFRQFLLAQLTGLTAEQLNKIPEGYNNNIIWNVAHLICAQQSLCYIRAEQPIIVEDRYFLPYRTGSRPAAFIEEPEIETIKRLFTSTIEDLQTDIDRGIFANYSPSENILRVYKVQLDNIDDALEFLLYHEGFHGGYITSLIRAVSRQ